MQISKWYRWGLFSHGKNAGQVIRRYRKVNGKKKWETYPKAKYQNFSDQEIEALLRRLNASFESEEIEARARYDYDNAFINKITIGEFEKRLQNKAENHEHIKNQIFILHEYVLKFFILQEKLPDPNSWKKREGGFGDFLLNSKSVRKGPLGGTYISRVIQTANRFLLFLHEYMPEEVRLIKLDPISDAILAARDSKSANRKRRKFITEEDYIRICKEVDPRILPLVKLSYLFGLRRAETLGLKVDDVFEDSLNVERQLTKIQPIAHYDKLKDKEERVVPYWYATPEETYELISSIKLVHPDTVSDFFGKACSDLGLPFQFHDLRRTWITRALREHNYMDVKLAAGHEDLETLQKYIQDDRQLQRRKFVPASKLKRV